MRTAKTYIFPIDVEQEEDGRWSAAVPILPGCATWGNTKAEALDSIEEAAHAYVAVLLEQKGALLGFIDAARRAGTLADVPQGFC